MSKGHRTLRKGDSGRMAGGFVALPWVVQDSPAWQSLSHPARSLLLDVARQLSPDNNGRLLASRAYLIKRGWKSSDVIARAIRELLEAGFLHQTVQGHRPAKASWFAVTWQLLCSDRRGFDHGTAETFRRGAFLDGAPLPKPKPTRVELYERWRKNAPLSPSHGPEEGQIGPSHGVAVSPPAPSHGPIDALLPPPSTPSHGHHLDIAIYEETDSVPPAAGGAAQAHHQTPAGLRRVVRGASVKTNVTAENGTERKEAP